MDAYDEGWEAFQSGMDENENPYDYYQSETEFREWAMGWEAAYEADVSALGVDLFDDDVFGEVEFEMDF